MTALARFTRALPSAFLAAGALAAVTIPNAPGQAAPVTPGALPASAGAAIGGAAVIGAL